MMPLTNTRTEFGSVTKSLHWLTALLILSVIALGLLANDLAHRINDPNHATSSEDIARAAWLFSLHKTIGIALFFLALMRIAWALIQPRPGLLNADNRIEATLAETVHWLLYGSLVLVPLTGWIHHAATTGFAPIWWPLGQSLPLVPKSTDVAAVFAALHLLSQKILLGALVLHIAGAVKHHFIDKDATLRRMLPGQMHTKDAPPAKTHSAVPFALSIAIWAGTLGSAALLGSLGTHKSSEPPVAELVEVQSDWQVQSGTLSIAITQLGSTVTGSFEDWTAAIRFDAPTAPGPAGDVLVTVAIASLTLGSVTSQAMGTDFFDVAQFPTAQFEAQIEKTQTGYVASGPLTIRGQTIQLEMPLDLNIDGNNAAMRASATLDRLDFGIGKNLQDESTLAFSVEITIDLNASRNAE